MTGGYAELRERLAKLLAGRYAVEDLLGAGGMAAVFRAKDVALDRVVAIKVLPPDLSHDERLVSRFEQEARIAAKLDHPNIIPIYRVESEGGLNYFVMKFVAGRSLEDVLAAGRPQDAAFTAGVLLEAAAALGHAHERGVVHRDVKPANIMLDASGRVILTDFGISKAVESAAGLTKTGIIVGTPHYMAPEQAMGSQVDGRADQYALACVGYHMLAGELPFPGDTAHSVLHRHIYEEPKPLAARRPDVPRPMVRAITRAMSKDPKDRFASMEEFAAALEGAAPDAAAARASASTRRSTRGGAVPPTVSVEGPTAPTSTRSATRDYERRMVRDRRLRIAGWVAAFVFVGAAGVAIARRSAGPTPGPVPAADSTTAPRTFSAADTVATHRDSAAAHDTTAAVAPAPAPPPAPVTSPPRRTVPKPAPHVDSATLNVGATPFGTVYLDNRNIGDTPLLNVKLAVGRQYELRIEHEGLKPYRRTLRPDGPNPINVNVHLDSLP